MVVLDPFIYLVDFEKNPEADPCLSNDYLPYLYWSKQAMGVEIIWWIA
jgi:hypothetical protein